MGRSDEYLHETDETIQEINIELGSEDVPEIEMPDAFAQEFEELKTLGGLSPAIKKRMSRISKKFEGTNGAASKKEELETITGYSLFEVIMPQYNLDYLAQLYEKSATHAAAINAKVANIVGIGYDLVESNKMKHELEDVKNATRLTNARKKLQKLKFEIFDEVDGWNKEDSFIETMKKVWVDYETTGNGYLEIGRQNNGKIGYLGHVSSTTMRVRRERDGFVQIISNRSVFFRNFGDRETVDPIGRDESPNEVIHFKKYSPNNAFYGVPDIISALGAVAGDEFAQRYNLDYFEHKAVPRYIIVVKGAKLGSASHQKLMQFFGGGLKGKNHRTLLVPLPPDTNDRKVAFTMEPVEAGKQDASFKDYRGDNKIEILMAHRVPISKVSITEGISIAMAKDSDKNFISLVCRPEQMVIEKKLGKVFKELTDAFDFVLNQISLTDADLQSQIDERYLRMKTMVPNEIRARMGMPGIEGGDKVVELKPEVAAEQTAQASGNRARDQKRTSNSSDSASSTQSRNAGGEGRKTK